MHGYCAYTRVDVSAGGKWQLKELFSTALMAGGNCSDPATACGFQLMEIAEAEHKTYPHIVMAVYAEYIHKYKYKYK